VSLEIRRATKDDAATIAALNADVQAIHADALPWRFKHPAASPYPAAEVESRLARPDIVAFLARQDGASVGYVIAEIIRQPDTARHHAHSTIYVHEISVRETARRHGIGRALLDAVKAHGEALGITTLALDTWAFNAGALAFFQRYGLVPYNVRMWNRRN